MYRVDTRGGLLAEGWADSNGTEEEGLEISRQRAEAVAREIHSALGVSTTAAGKGRSAFPPDSSEENKQVNRRVVIKLPAATK
jgi:outer membrane protein OmpA-like peptidoglycan-associated protein